MKEVTAYVDGSYNSKIERYGYGCVILTPEGERETLSGSGNNPETLALPNVSGEMLAAMHAVRWAIREGYDAICICYDYSGIEKWATGEWKRKNPLTAQYHDYMNRCRGSIRIRFEKVEAHSGVALNEEADRLAKEAILRDAAAASDWGEL